MARMMDDDSDHHHLFVGQVWTTEATARTTAASSPPTFHLHQHQHQQDHDDSRSLRSGDDDNDAENATVLGRMVLQLDTGMILILKNQDHNATAHDSASSVECTTKNATSSPDNDDSSHSECDDGSSDDDISWSAAKNSPQPGTKDASEGAVVPSDRAAWGAFKGTIEIKIRALKKSQEIRAFWQSILFVIAVVSPVLAVVSVLSNYGNDDVSPKEEDHDLDASNHYYTTATKWSMKFLAFFYSLIVTWVCTKYEKNKREENKELALQLLESIVEEVDDWMKDDSAACAYSAIIENQMTGPDWKLITLYRRSRISSLTREKDGQETLSSSSSSTTIAGQDQKRLLTQKTCTVTKGTMQEIPVNEFLVTIPHPDEEGKLLDLWTWGGLKLVLDEERLAMDQQWGLTVIVVLVCCWILPLTLISKKIITEDDHVALLLGLSLGTSLAVALIYELYFDYIIAPALHERCRLVVAEEQHNMGLDRRLLTGGGRRVHISYRVKPYYYCCWRRLQGILRFETHEAEDRDDGDWTSATDRAEFV